MKIGKKLRKVEEDKAVLRRANARLAAERHLLVQAAERHQEGEKKALGRVGELMAETDRLRRDRDLSQQVASRESRRNIALHDRIDRIREIIDEPVPGGPNDMGEPPLDQAQARLASERGDAVVVYTSASTPMSIADALGILLEELRRDHGRIQGDLFGPDGTFTADEIQAHEQAHAAMGHKLRLDSGLYDPESHGKLHDALATLRMVVR